MKQHRRQFLGTMASALGGACLASGSLGSADPADPAEPAKSDLGALVAKYFHKEGRS